MPRYERTPAPAGEYAEWLNREHSKLVQTTRSPFINGLEWVILHAAPERPFVGLEVYADGSDWDPGSGEGLYIYKSGGWTFVA